MRGRFPIKKGKNRVRTRLGEVFEIEPVAGVLNVFEVRALSSGARIGLIQRSPFCLIPSRKNIREARLLEEIFHEAVAAGLIPPAS